jgi:tetratricopeptide (TPR) repeat protein
MDDLATYFNTRSYWLEWMHLAELAVADADEAKDPKLKAEALNNLSVVYRQLERLPESIQCCQESREICQRSGDQYGEGLSLGNLGGTYFAQGNFQASYESYMAATKTFKVLEELYDQAQCLMGMGIVLAKQQKLDEASSYLAACIKIQKRIGDRFGEAQTLNNLGIVQKMQKRFFDAIKSFQKSLLIKRQIGDQQGMANSLTNLAVAYEHSGKIIAAITSWEEALAVSRDLNRSDTERIARRLAQIRVQMKEKI